MMKYHRKMYLSRVFSISVSCFRSTTYTVLIIIPSGWGCQGGEYTLTTIASCLMGLK